MNPSRLPGKSYNYLCKRVILRVADPLFSTLFDMRVLGVREVRSDEEQSLIVGRPDVVLTLDFDDQSDVLVRLDLQTHDDPESGHRLAKHFVALKERFGRVPKCVGFLDDAARKYRNGVTFRSPMGTGMALNFTAFNFSELPAEWFLADDDPFGLMLAMFCDRARVSDERLVDLAARLAPKMTEDETQHFLLSLRPALCRGRIHKRRNLQNDGRFFRKGVHARIGNGFIDDRSNFRPLHRAD